MLFEKGGWGSSKTIKILLIQWNANLALPEIKFGQQRLPSHFTILLGVVGQICKLDNFDSKSIPE